MADNNGLNSPFPLAVAKGGTGSSTLPASGVLVGNGTSPISSLNLTNGQLLIGNTGLNPNTAQLSAGPGINITNGAGSITISTDSSDIPFNGIQIYVSQQVGSDISGTGSITQPLATFGAAITLAGSPPPTAPITIIGMDGNQYNEQLIINNPNVYISAPFAQLGWNAVGDTITINASGSGTLLNIASIANTGGGNSIVNNVDETIILNALNLTNGDVVNNGAGFLLIQSDIIGINLTNTGGGNIFYLAALRAGGTDSAGIVGLNPAGSTSPVFTVPSLAFNPTTQGIVGTTAADNAASGYVGEYFESIILSGSAVSIPDDTDVDVTSIPLPAGDFDIYGNVYFIDAGNFIRGVAWCSITSSSMPDKSLTNQIAIAANTSEQGISTPYLRVNVSSPTTVYLSCHAVFSSTMTVCGGIYARRVR